MRWSTRVTRLPPASRWRPVRADAVVAQVEPGSSAARAGLKAGDAHLMADGLAVERRGEPFSRFQSGRESGSIHGQFWLMAARQKRSDNWKCATAATRRGRLRSGRGRFRCIRRSFTKSISMFLLFLLLTAYYPFRRHDGQVMALLMICYACIVISMKCCGPTNGRSVSRGGQASCFLSPGGAVDLAWTRPAQYRLRTKEPPRRGSKRRRRAIRPPFSPATVSTTATTGRRPRAMPK